MQQVPQALQHCHELLLWMIPHIDKFPRVRRFTLGERLETRLLEVLENLVEAAYTKNKKMPLTSANRQLEIVCHLWRLSFELHRLVTKFSKLITCENHRFLFQDRRSRASRAGHFQVELGNES
jgi:hypothetical protein